MSKNTRICKDIVCHDIGEDYDLLWTNKEYINDDNLRTMELKRDIEIALYCIESEYDKIKKNSKKVCGKIGKKFLNVKIKTYNKQIELLNDFLRNTNFDNLSFEECCEVFNKSLEIRTMVFTELGNEILFSDYECFLVAKKIGFIPNIEERETRVKNNIIHMMEEEMENNSVLILLKAKFLCDKNLILNRLNQRIDEYNDDLERDIDLCSKVLVKA